MVTITSLRMWRDPGYTRGCTEVPPADSDLLPTPDYQLAAGETLRPRKNSIMDALELPLSYSAVREMSYLSATFEDGSGSFSVYGWIIAIEQIANAAEAVRIRWTVDHWRTFARSVTWGSGRITRTADDSIAQRVNIQARWWKASIKDWIRMSDLGQACMWCIFSVNVKSGDTVTAIRTYAFPTGRWDDNAELIGAELGDNPMHLVGYCPPLSEIYQGHLYNFYGFAAENINAIWLSPLAPIWNSSESGTGTVIVPNSSFITHSYNNRTYAAVEVKFNFSNEHVWTSDIADYIPTDKKRLAVCDSYGRIYGTANWRKRITGIQGWVEVGTSSARMCIRFITDGGTANLAQCENDIVELPLISVPMVSNAYSAYVYSGQRDFEIANAKTAQEKNLWGSLLGVGGSAAGGAITASMISGSAAAGPIGLLAGAGIGIASGIGGYALDEMHRDRLQGYTDDYYQSQIPNLMLPGEGQGWRMLLYYYAIVELEPDDVSLSDFDAMIATNGYPTDHDVLNVAPYIANGGPIQIQNLNLTGAIPPESKQNIKQMLSAGVRIIERNGEMRT